MARFIIVASIIVYPLLALLIIRKIIKKQNNTNSANALDYYSNPKRIVDYRCEKDELFLSVDNSLLPVEINGNKTNEKDIKLQSEDVLIKNDKFEENIVCVNKELIANDFRDIGGLAVDKGFIAFNKIYRMANISNLNTQQTEEIQKTNFVRVFNLNNKIKLKNNKINFTKDNSVSINILTSISNVISFLNQSKLDYFTWHAHQIFESIIDEKKNVGRLLKKIMKAEGSVIIQDGDGHYQTAVIVMLVLMMLGVDKDTIAKEYSISNLSVKQDTTLKSDIHNLAVIANPVVIQKVINNIDGTYDTREKFFNELEINKELIEEFKNKMIVKTA